MMCRTFSFVEKAFKIFVCIRLYAHILMDKFEVSEVLKEKKMNKTKTILKNKTINLI